MNDFDTFTKIVGDLGKIIVASGFEWLSKVQEIAQSGHTDYRLPNSIAQQKPCAPGTVPKNC